MKNRITLTFVFIGLFSAFLIRTSFSQSFADSAGCHNFSGYTSQDSIMGLYNYVKYETSQSDLSPGRRYLATSMINDNFPVWGDFYMGSVVIDLKERRFQSLHPGTFRPKWSPDGRRLLFIDYIYDLGADSIIQFPQPPRECSLWSPQWSVDGEYVFFQVACGGSGTSLPVLRFKVVNREETQIPFIHGAKQLSDSVLFYIPSYFYKTQKRFYLVYNMTTAATDTVFTPELDFSPEFEGIRDIFNLVMSKSRRFFAADVGFFSAPEGRPGLGMYDFKQRRFKEILKEQSLFRNFYYPSWTSDSTMLISFVCHLDSSYTTWEIDTNGVFLKRLTDKTLIPRITGISEPPVVPDVANVNFYPHPASGTTTVEYDVQKTGYLSLVLIDLSGREVRSVKRDSWHEPGRHAAHFRTDDLPAGLYLLRLSRSGAALVYRKLIVE